MARVAKISLFMHGAGDANIIFGDGLETNAEKQILDNKFSILVANPPYSVQGFKSHLKIKNKDSFLILDKISNEGSEIECLFVERTAQLLAPNGVAAIILPSSILSNNSNSYVAARENILNNFMIKAIVSLGSGTFSETGTNTVILFLQKYNEPPKMSDLAKDCLSFIFDSLGKLSLLKDWKEKEIYTSFLSLIGVSEDVYGSFLKEEYSYDDLMQGEEVSLNYFKQYAALIFSSSTIKNMEGKKFFAEMDVEAQKKEKMKYFYREVKEKEREKLLYFSLLFGHKTLLVRSPESNDAQKEFLGYGWSKRKGDEGIKIIKLGGTLYAGDDREAEGTIAFLIRNAFEGSFEIDEKMKTYAQVVMSTSLLDFSNSSFTKSIKTVIKEKTEIKSKWKMVRLGEMAEVVMGNSAPKETELFENGTHPFFRTSDIGKLHLSKNMTSSKDYLNELGIKGLKQFSKGTILLPKSGASTYLNHRVIMGVDGYVSSHLAGVIAKNKIIETQYLYEILVLVNAKEIKQNSGYPSLTTEDIKNIRVPLPPLDIQQKLVAECEEVDKEYESSRMSVEEYKRRIEALFKELEIIEKTGGRYKLGEICDILIGGTPSRNKPEYFTGANLWVSIAEMNGNGITDTKEKITTEAIKNSNVKLIKKGTTLLSFKLSIGKTAIAGADLYTNEAIAALIPKNNNILNKYLFYLFNSKAIDLNNVEYKAFGKSLNSAFLNNNLTIPVPPLSIQKELVAKAEVFETEISKHTKIMNEAKAKKEAIIKKYIL